MTGAKIAFAGSYVYTFMKRSDWFKAKALINAAVARARPDALPSSTNALPPRDRSATPAALPAVPAATPRNRR